MKGQTIQNIEYGKKRKYRALSVGILFKGTRRLREGRYESQWKVLTGLWTDVISVQSIHTSLVAALNTFLRLGRKGMRAETSQETIEIAEVEI